MAETVNENEIRIIGMSRSGNHAIIQWIQAQARGRVCFLNCTEGKTNPFVTARPLEDDVCCQTNYDPFFLTAERQGRFSRKDYLINSHEDSFLAYACSDAYEEFHDTWVGPSRNRYDILILRDPYNLFASRRYAGMAENSEQTALRIWKQHARQFLRKIRRLKHNPVLINYNRWSQEKAYRGKIAEQLGLTFTDACKEKVARCYAGSSFDGTRFDGQADRMRVLERWRHYRDDPGFWAVFDEDTHAMSRKIFGDVVDEEYLFPELAEPQTV